MDEFEKTAEQSELSGAQGNGDADVSKQQASTDIETDFSEEPKGEGNGAQRPFQPWRDEENRKNALRRREERDRRIRQEAIIDAIGGVNPFTGEEVKDAADVEEYLLMRKIDKEGGDPLQDYSKQKKAQERERLAQREKQEKEEQWYASDRAAFLERYPDVDISSLISDERFGLYAEGKVGVKPLADIYEGFLRLTGEYEQRAKDMAAQYYANSRATPGALSSPETAPSDFFTADEVRKMTPAEVKKNYDKIMDSMKKW